MKTLYIITLLLALSFINADELRFLHFNRTNGYNHKSIIDKALGLMNGVTAIINGIDSILDCLKNSRSDVIKEILNTTSFDTFIGNTMIEMSVVRHDKIKKYLNGLKTLVKVPQKFEAEFLGIIDDFEEYDSQTWLGNEFVFNKDSPDNDLVNYATVITSEEETEDGTSPDYNVIAVTNTISFKLSPNVMVRTKSLSIMSGIYTKVEDYEVEMPKNLTPEDMKLLMNYFQAISFRKLAIELGIEVPPVPDK